MLSDLLNNVSSGGDGSAGAGAGASSFDGIIKGWPEQALTVSNVPKERKEFILYMACELFKAQHITDPKKQANNAINYAKSLYDALSSKGYFEK